MLKLVRVSANSCDWSASRMSKRMSRPPIVPGKKIEAGEEQGALPAKGVVSDDELALASVEGDGACRLWEGEGAFGGGDCEGEGDVVPARGPSEDVV